MVPTVKLLLTKPPHYPTYSYVSFCLLQGVVFDLPNEFNEIVKVTCVTNLDMSLSVMHVRINGRIVTELS